MPRSRYSYELPAHDVDYGVTVQVDDLKIDPQAQRTLNEKRAQGIADAMVPEALGSIIVSQRSDGTRYIVDGMHRVRACQLVGRPTIAAECTRVSTVREEAILFLIKNRESNKPNAIDEYRIGLTAGLPLFVDTDKVLIAHKLEMGNTSTNGVGAVSGVLRITDNFGPDILDRTLTIAEEAWGRSPQTWDGMLLGGIGMFVGRHGDVIKDSELAIKMAKTGMAQLWIGRVHTISSSGGLHNSGTGSRVTVCYNMLKGVWNKGKTKNKIV